MIDQETLRQIRDLLLNESVKRFEQEKQAERDEYLQRERMKIDTLLKELEVRYAANRGEICR